MSFTRVLRTLLIVAGVALALTAGGAWIAGSLLLHQDHRSTVPAPGRGMEAVRFAASDGVALKGWWWPGRDPERAVLLLHGLHADRLQMFPRAKWLHGSGYSVFLFDFRGCGESGGSASLGYRERLDVEAALRFLREKKKVGETVVIGQSLGAAAAILAVDAWTEGMKGAVLESPFDRLENAVRIRVRRIVGPLEPLVSPLLLVQVRPRLGFPPEELAPLEAIHRGRCPVLIGFGGRDPTITAGVPGAFFREAPYPATLWVVQKAEHTDLYRFNPKAYQEKVGEFLGKNLGPPEKKPGE